MIDKILLKRRYLINYSDEEKTSPYFALKLLNEFGVEVDNFNLVSKHNLDTISSFYGVEIPPSFYDNPQDTKYFSCKELVLEQIISYINVESNGVNSLNEEVFKRIPLFKKVLPNYKEGKEVVLRNYKIISKSEAQKKLGEITLNYVNYTRPWSNDEFEEFKWLYKNGFYNGEKLLCKDNIISLLKEYKKVEFAKMLDKKDVVKFSVSLKGETNKLSFNSEEQEVLALAIKNAYSCPMSKKQAKYFNTIAKHLSFKDVNESNINSPYKKAKEALANNDVLKASKIFSSSGSLLERNLVYLLSRAKEEEAIEIIKDLKMDNPILLYQLIEGIVQDDYKTPRVFHYSYNNLTKYHEESDYEFKYRKSKLSPSLKTKLVITLREMIENYYKSLPSLGKIYVNEEFKNIALPVNTSATGSGLDILPIGSRIKIKGDYIRTFCYWKDIFDIDASATLIKDINDKEYDVMYWGSYSLKPFGKSALCSGDARGKDGAEYQDFKISELIALGYKYVIYSLNGFDSFLNIGEIYCGYQDKNDLKSKAWSSKNIAFKINVKGDTRAFIGFAIDLINKEIIVLNQKMNSNDRVINPSDVKAIKQYLAKDYLSTFNMYDLLSLRGEKIDINEATYVFDKEYIAGNLTENNDISNQQIVIRPFEIEKLVTLLK